MTRIKICGLTREEDVAFVNAFTPEYCGFVVNVPRSRRTISPERVGVLSRLLAPQITAAGVFVNAPVEVPATLAREGSIQVIQLHGQEEEDYLERLRRLTQVPVIQAFPIAGKADVQRAKKSSADWILLDQGKGGTGQTFDWELAKGLERPFFLAGGLTPENLPAALERVRPWCVDLSSGVETDGKKDREKIKAAVAAVRRKYR